MTSWSDIVSGIGLLFVIIIIAYFIAIWATGGYFKQ